MARMLFDIYDFLSAYDKNESKRQGEHGGKLDLGVTTFKDICQNNRYQIRRARSRQ